MNTFYKAWKFLNAHPAFNRPYSYTPKSTYNGFAEALNIEVVLVNPKTNRIDKKQSLNTKVQIWLECGEWIPARGDELLSKDYLGAFCHDYDLDCGADTFEEGIIQLAKLVKKYYKK